MNNIMKRLIILLMLCVVAQCVCAVVDEDNDGVPDDSDLCPDSIGYTDEYGCDCDQKKSCTEEWCCPDSVCSINHFFQAECMTDYDNDGVGDYSDSGAQIDICLNLSNPASEDCTGARHFLTGQCDADLDGIGDACDDELNEINNSVQRIDPILLNIEITNETINYNRSNLLIRNNSNTFCAETDSGIDIFNKGKTMIYNNSKNESILEEDTCASNQLKEYYCRGNAIAIQVVYCEYGCEDGACIKSEPQITAAYDYKGTIYMLYSDGTYKTYVGGSYESTGDLRENKAWEGEKAPKNYAKIVAAYNFKNDLYLIDSDGYYYHWQNNQFISASHVSTVPAWNTELAPKDYERITAGYTFKDSIFILDSSGFYKWGISSDGVGGFNKKDYFTNNEVWLGKYAPDNYGKIVGAFELNDKIYVLTDNGKVQYHIYYDGSFQCYDELDMNQIGDCNTVNKCAKEGEKFSKVYKDEFPEKCCEGLTEWNSGFDTSVVINGECVQRSIESGSPVGTCINCGNGICEEIENICNCPEDCKETAVCSSVYNPVCGKDGKTYPNSCEAGLAKVKVLYEGKCDYCEECGKGFWNMCDKKECASLGNCYFKGKLFSGKCYNAYETDNGIDIYEKGMVKGEDSSVHRSNKAEDKCISIKELREYFLYDKINIHYEDISCDCSDGVCKKNYINCSEFGDEFWCGTYKDWKGQCGGEGTIHEPSPGCDTGTNEYGYCVSCMDINRSCVDTDGVWNLNEFGSATGKSSEYIYDITGKENGTFDDYCVDNSTIFEYGCYNGLVSGDIGNCELGCKDGACVRGASVCPGGDCSVKYADCGKLGTNFWCASEEEWKEECRGSGFTVPVKPSCGVETASGSIGGTRDYCVTCRDKECRSDNDCPQANCVGCYTYCDNVSYTCKTEIKPYCNNNQWYESGSAVNRENCQGCFAECKAAGTRSEGWYSSCTGNLIKYDNCV
jgi:hypothetical protein